ncbi:MAG: toll/interleukin-1 receptor domain-containing protein [Lentimicrobiaceae bacterium]|jgi:nucleoside 2-deoxyribosyltransferase|nr:toll/interleukin-1 receptor domain-containing protein [Lentimicrobiaceae bacterium]
MDKKKIFICYAIEDKELLEKFLKEAKKENVPYQLVYLKEKEPMSATWREECRSKIKACDGVVALISKNLKISEGAFWEMKCSREEGKPRISMFVGDAGIIDKPRDLDGVTAMVLSWDRLAYFVSKI